MSDIFITRSEDSLAHYGVLGMKWGVRRYQPYPDGSNSKGRFLGKVKEVKENHYKKKQVKTAKKDAKEFARAKMYYGEGAGTRRKLIKATVNQRSKDKTYKEAFDKALSEQDMSKHASKARSERRRNDIKNNTAQQARGVVNIISGNPYRAAASTIAVYGVLKITGMDKVIINKGQKMVSDAAPYVGHFVDTHLSDTIAKGTEAAYRAKQRFKK